MHALGSLLHSVKVDPVDRKRAKVLEGSCHDSSVWIDGALLLCGSLAYDDPAQ